MTLMTDQRAFPPVPPADLSAADVIVRTDWHAYSGLDRLVNHWDRPGWDSSTRRLYWMLTFAQDQPLVECAARCQHDLQHLGLDPIPADGLHLTVLRIGNAADVPPAVVDALCQQVAALALPSLALVAHPLAGSRGAVRFSVTPWAGLVRMHHQLSAVGRGLGVPGGAATGRFRPHLGIAYNPFDRPAGPVLDAVAPLRTIPPVPLKIRTLDLVELRRADRQYKWRTLRSIALA